MTTITAAADTATGAASHLARTPGVLPPGSAHLDEADRVGLLRAMLTMRLLEERAGALYRQGKVPGSFYDGYGQEAISVGATWALSSRDRVLPLHRDLGAHIVRGTDLGRILGQYMGRAGGVSGGREANVHFGETDRGVVGMVSMLPDMMMVATGMAMAFKLRRQQRVSLTFFGDGATSRGDFHEAMNWAGVQRLPVIFVLEDNGYAYSTSTDRQFAVDPIERAGVYGFPGVSVDGNDPEAVFEQVRIARARGLADEGPTLIVARTMRMHGHAAHDDQRYVPPEQLELWRGRDPIDRQTARVRQLGVDPDKVRAEVLAEIEAGTQAALAMPMPEPAAAFDRVLADERHGLGDGGLAPWSGFAADPGPDSPPEPTAVGG